MALLAYWGILSFLTTNDVLFPQSFFRCVHNQFLSLYTQSASEQDPVPKGLEVGLTSWLQKWLIWDSQSILQGSRVHPLVLVSVNVGVNKEAGNQEPSLVSRCRCAGGQPV